MNLEQLKLAIKLPRVKRFQTHHTQEVMSVADHSFRVCALYSYFGGKEPEASLFHDLEEALTGDIPSPAKKDLQGLDKFEALRPQFQNASEKRLNKMCDKLDLILHIRKQVKYDDELMTVYENELEMMMDIAKELNKTKEVKRLLKELT